MDKEKKDNYRVVIFKFEEGKVPEATDEIYSQVFGYLSVSEVVKKLNGGY